MFYVYHEFIISPVPPNIDLLLFTFYTTYDSIYIHLCSNKRFIISICRIYIYKNGYERAQSSLCTTIVIVTARSAPDPGFDPPFIVNAGI